MEQNLEKEIELLREAMVNVAVRDGLTAEETIEFSKKLDILINKYNKIIESHH
ncbi:aspartyl-phosphate phosphatase Spo0E family protein [Sporosarcina sp. YIM B06819]|uniref:aspartyl-phosphate phosphatase Spo0E family protein n=1 Tax=Sporosarcina sp. YIM B06819 TaxID=3081769 RepID=UPI00298C0AC9|nr:aspartyl-phosphate phosphatase Spo0E family protein [Sporosarcina sp. YIM B06819]